MNRSLEVLEHKQDYDHRSFAFCRRCYWIASLFTKKDSYECPVCHHNDVEVKPLDFIEGLLLTVNVKTMSLNDFCVDCRHKRENHMSFSGKSECDFPDCNCHGYRE
ncbi:MAG TPA: hypothetical protein VI146_08270 [Nitrososphaeraceae archaeon]